MDTEAIFLEPAAGGQGAVPRCVQGRTYFLRENVTGAEDGTCRFSVRLEGGALHFRFCVNAAPYSPFREDNEDIWQADAVEVFLSPDGCPDRYKELEVSPYGVRFYADIACDGRRLPRADKTAPAFTAATRLAAGGYEAEICLPLAALAGFDAAAMRFNAFCLCGSAAGKQRLLALCPTLCPTFHKPQRFVALAEQ